MFDFGVWDLDVRFGLLRFVWNGCWLFEGGVVLECWIAVSLIVRLMNW